MNRFYQVLIMDREASLVINCSLYGLFIFLEWKGLSTKIRRNRKEFDITCGSCAQRRGKIT